MNDNPTPMAAASPEVFQQLGQLTRQLHDTLSQLGLMPKLRQSVEGLPDARSRLSYIARKTGEAADKVLTAVELAKLEHAGIAASGKRLSASLTAGIAPAAPAATIAGVMAFVGEVEAATTRIDQHLTDIMLAQDFHDLTGQVVAKVVALATDLEDSLVKLLVQVAPAELVVPESALADLHGPVVDAAGRTDVVSSQGEVDDLLASLGF